MKVLHITNLYPTNSYPTYGIFVYDQIESLRPYGEQSYYFINAKEKGLVAYLRAIFELRSLIKTVDIIHCHHQFSVLPLLLYFTKKPIILSVLGDIKKRNWVNKVVFHLVKNKCSSIIFKNSVPDSANNKYILIPNGVNLSIFKPLSKTESRRKLNLNENDCLVLFVCNGSLDNPIKRKDKFDKILSQLNQKSNDVKYKELILSNVSRLDVPLYYNAANLMLMTSNHEGSPNAIKEAMACNLPIVSTPVGDVKKNIDGVENSFVANSHDDDELYELVQKINTEKRSDGLQKLIQLKLDSTSVAEKLMDLYTKTIDKAQ